MVIDLDAPVPVRPETARRGARPVALVVVVLIVLTLAGSAGPPAVLRMVLGVDTSGAFALTSSALFTAGFGRAPGRQAIIRRFPLAAGLAPWAVEVPQTVGNLHVVGGVLVAEPAQVLIATAADQQQTTFLDSDTGAVLWRTRTTGVLRLAGSGALITEAGRLRHVDLRTGRTRWSRALGPSARPDAGSPGRVISVDRRGRATVLGDADGTLLAEAELAAAPGDTARYAAAGDHLYLARQDDGAASLTAYRLPDLRPLWRTAVPAGRPSWCGPEHVCLTTAGGVTVLDRSTGRVRWSEDRWRTGFDSRALGIGGPRRIAVVDGRPDAGGALLDPATGEVTAMLGAVTFAGAAMLRADLDRPGRTLLQVVGAAGEVRTVGALDSIVATRCESFADHLACPTTHGRLEVWRVPG